MLYDNNDGDICMIPVLHFGSQMLHPCTLPNIVYSYDMVVSLSIVKKMDKLSISLSCALFTPV